MNDPIVVSRHEYEHLRSTRWLYGIVAVSSTIGLILACALFGPPAYQQEQQRRVESVRLTIQP